MTQAVRIDQLCFQGSVSKGFAMYLPQKTPFAADRSLVLYIEICDSNRQRGATGLTVERVRALKSDPGLISLGKKSGVHSRRMEARRLSLEG